MGKALNVSLLRELLTPRVGGEVEPLLRRFLREQAEGDETDFVAWLHHGGRITSVDLREVISSLEVSFTLSEATSDQVGRRGRPRHRLLGLLGKGAMGEVHVARDEDLHRNVALKRMDPKLAGEPLLARRFLTEVQITAQLDHPGIVPVYGIERDADGLLAYSMKLVRGRTLKEFMADTRAFHDRGERPDMDHALPARIGMFLQICDAMDYAHVRNVIHRDLKPDNIMVGPFGEVLVMDWGIARVVDGEETVSEVELEGGLGERTQMGMAIGTPSYMSPEQAEGRNDDMDGRSDLFTLGLILQEMTTVRRARVAKTGAKMLLAAAEGRVERIVPLSPRERVPRELVAVIRKATQKRRRDRYQTVEELADDVRRYQRGEAVLAKPDTMRQRLSRWIGRHRDTSAAIGLALVLLVFVVGAVAVSGGLVAVEVGRNAAAERESRLGDLLAVVSNQARSMDRQFQRYEGLLQGLAFTTERVLQSEPEAHEVYLLDDYATAGRGPPDLAPSPVYDGPVSLDFPDFALAPGVSPRAVQRRLWQLSALQPYFRRVLLQSAAEDAVTLDPRAQRALIAETGTPVVWAYVALEEGMLSALPGTGVYPAAYDPRDRPWYGNAKGRRAPHWGSVYLDESGMGLLLDCGTGLFDASGAFLGVAALDVTVGYLVDELLDPAGLAAPVEAYLVGADGKIVVQSRLKESARTGKDYEPTPLPWPQVIDAVKGGTQSGHVEVRSAAGDDDLLVWTRLDAVPWTYLVVGKSEGLLGG